VKGLEQVQRRGQRAEGRAPGRGRPPLSLSLSRSSGLTLGFDHDYDNDNDNDNDNEGKGCRDCRGTASGTLGPRAPDEHPAFVAIGGRAGTFIA
jgi:hypothetical protein